MEEARTTTAFLLPFFLIFCFSDGFAHIAATSTHKQIAFLASDPHIPTPLPPSPCDVVILISNDQLEAFSKSRVLVSEWIQNNIVARLSHMNIVAVAVGNGLTTAQPRLFPLLIPLLKSIHGTVAELKLAHQIKVTTLDSLIAFHPAAVFPSSRKEFLLSLLDFLSSTGSYLILNNLSVENGVDTVEDALHATFEFMASLNYRVIPVLVVDDLRCREPWVAPYQSYLEQLEGGNIDSCASSIVNTTLVHSRNMLFFRGRALLQRSTTPKLTWCVAKPGIDDSTLQAALDYACGQGSADCKPIKLGGSCFLPNNVTAHASYVFNSYYQKNAKGAGTCSFSGAAMVTTDDPSIGPCKFPSSGSLNQTILTIQESSATVQRLGLYVLPIMSLIMALLS